MSRVLAFSALALLAGQGSVVLAQTTPQPQPTANTTAVIGVPAQLAPASGPVPVAPLPAAPALSAPSAQPAAAAFGQTLSQPFDYSINLKSDVFGANLFSGAFTRPGPIQFNPDYAVAIGDQIQVRFWGAYPFDAVLTVDPQGNIFLPNVGPVRLVGVKNKDVQQVVEAALRRVYRNNVYSYASLAMAQPVRVFVGGFVNRPGLYNGTSMDSLLHYLDQAGGIDPDRGSFLNVQVKRGGTARENVSLYRFLLDGSMPLIQLADGDVIFVPARRNTVKVDGFAENTKRFEFADSRIQLSQLLEMARPYAMATHVRVTRSMGTIRNVEYYPLEQAAQVYLNNGDEVEFTSDKKPGTITVRVEGEHLSPQEYVLPYGSRFGDLIRQVSFSERSDADSLQLYRQSVKDRQRSMLQTTLQTFQSSILTARSSTSDEARLRTDEAALLMQWVERAKQIEPSGQVVIAQAGGRDSLLLENGDVIRVPARDGLVLVSGEVLFPNSIAYESKLALADYIRAAGGYTQNADVSRIVIAHLDGSFDQLDEDGGMFSSGKTATVRAGDQVLILPKVDVKSRQIWKDMTQIIYQIAVAAKVVLGL